MYPGSGKSTLRGLVTDDLAAVDRQEFLFGHPDQLRGYTGRVRRNYFDGPAVWAVRWFISIWPRRMEHHSLCSAIGMPHSTQIARAASVAHSFPGDASVTTCSLSGQVNHDLIRSTAPAGSGLGSNRSQEKGAKVKGRARTNGGLRKRQIIVTGRSHPAARMPHPPEGAVVRIPLTFVLAGALVLIGSGVAQAQKLIRFASLCADTFSARAHVRAAHRSRPTASPPVPGPAADSGFLVHSARPPATTSWRCRTTGSARR